MSVGALARVRMAIEEWRASDLSLGERDKLNAALDRLVLEVQAEMPCYLAWDELLPEPWEPICAGGVYCPSCAAREKLKVAV